MFNVYAPFGAIIGDICGSRYEFDNYKADHEIQPFKGCWITDDSIHTLATMMACIYAKKNFDKNKQYGSFKFALEVGMQRALLKMYELYPNVSYGEGFRAWAKGDDHSPYMSFGNGAAMRVSPVAYIADTEAEVLDFAKAVAEPTHNHPEGIKGAQATALAVWMAMRQYTNEEIYERVKQFYDIPEYIDLLGNYHFDESCQGTVPQALSTFFASENFVDCLHKSIKVGGDTDTLAAIACSIASAKYIVPAWYGKMCSKFLDGTMRKIITKFYGIVNSKLLQSYKDVLFTN